MLLDEECKGCLFNSQLKKVERDQSDKTKVAEFSQGVKKLCENPPADYCAPLLMRDIDRLHRKIFGAGIDYSREKRLFNGKLLENENCIYQKVSNSDDPVKEAVKLAMASNYIDFARLSDLDGRAVDYVLQSAERAEPGAAAFGLFKQRLKTARTLCVLHDNCGEIVLDKILIRVLKNLYPAISVTSVVRGEPIINDVTADDAEFIGLGEYARVIQNGSGVPGTYLKEVSAQTLQVLKTSDIIISKGLGNLETLYGEGYSIFYTFTCKCEHISKRFGLPLWSAGFVTEEKL